MKELITVSTNEALGTIQDKLRGLALAVIGKTLTVKFSLYLDSKTDIAANEPEPIVANGSVSVDPCG